MAKRLLIAGGGTGGHLFPGMAVAEEFVSRDPENSVLFVGTSSGIESRLVPEAGYDFRAIRSMGIAGKGAFGKLRGAAVIPLSVLDALGVVKSWKPHAALGVGGYVSGPAILSAWLYRVPCAIQEQNAAPGWTNRILARFVKRIFVSFDKTDEYFPKREKVVVSGNPVRKKIVDSVTAEKWTEKDKDSGKFCLLVVGGSQGARGLNRLFIAALAELSPEDREMMDIRHQAGKGDMETVTGAYNDMKMDALVEPFIDDMADAYSRADLVVSRSGAGAVSEIALAGKPAIFVPFPFAALDHQTANAAALVDSGAALMFKESDTDPADFATAIKSLMENRKKLEEMAEKAGQSARPDAAKLVVDHCLEMMEAG